MERSVIKVGNCLMVAIPPSITELLDIQKGDKVDIKLTTDKKVTIEKVIK